MIAPARYVTGCTFWSSGEKTLGQVSLASKGKMAQLWKKRLYYKGETCRSQPGGTQKGP